MFFDVRFLLSSVLLTAASVVPVCAQQNNSTDQYRDFERVRVGGYGELVAAHQWYGDNRYYGHSEGNAADNRNTISMPRFVLAFDYKFTPKWILGAEIEFESGGTGTAYELENTENGEYETEVERGGEVALEQFHITRLIHPTFNVRAGHLIVPVGLTNSHHEPINFFGSVRPEGETTIMPSTWHETGVEFFGSVGSGWALFDYQAQIVAGLNANGFDRTHWAGDAKQGIFEQENFSSPAYVLRVDYKGVKGLRAGGSVYYCADICENADKSQTYSTIEKAPLRIYTADAQYKNRLVEARANFVWGNLTNSATISNKNTKLSNKSPYSRWTPVAHRAVSFGGEAGLKVKGLVDNSKFPDLIPFVRYEYYNTQEEVSGLESADKRCQVSMWTWGLNYRILPNLAVKLDYTNREIGTRKMFGDGLYNAENELAIGLCYTAWFWKK